MKCLGAQVHGEYVDVLTIHEFENVVPSLAEQDVLIKIAFADVNPVDLQKLRGRPNDQNKPVVSCVNDLHVPGYGGSGIVLQVGSAVVPEVFLNKPVVFMCDPSRAGSNQWNGSYATHAVVDCRCVVPIPDVTMLREAACIPIAGLTAFESLSKCDLMGSPSYPSTLPQNNNNNTHGNGKRLLIVGASGGVGSWTVSLARAMCPGLDIVATASSAASQQWCQELGANTVMEHDKIGERLEGGREGSVDAIICLAEPTTDLFSTLSNVIKPYGTIVLVVAGKSIEYLNLGFCFFKCVDVKCVTVFSTQRTKYQHIVPAAEMQVILDFWKGGLRIPLSPDVLEDGGAVSASAQDAAKDNGVLKELSKPHGRCGNYIMKVDFR